VPLGPVVPEDELPPHATTAAIAPAIAILLVSVPIVPIVCLGSALMVLDRRRRPW
jgi:hypothetical protein